MNCELNLCAIQHLLRLTQPSMEGRVKAKALAWYEAGFRTWGAVRPWLVDAKVFEPEVAKKFEVAGVKPAELNCTQLGLCGNKTLGEQVNEGLVEPLEAIALLRGVMTSAELKSSKERS